MGNSVGGRFTLYRHNCRLSLGIEYVGAKAIAAASAPIPLNKSPDAILMPANLYRNLARSDVLTLKLSRVEASHVSQTKSGSPVLACRYLVARCIA